MLLPFLPVISDTCYIWPSQQNSVQRYSFSVHGGSTFHRSTYNEASMTFHYQIQKMLNATKSSSIITIDRMPTMLIFRAISAEFEKNFSAKCYQQILNFLISSLIVSTQSTTEFNSYVVFLHNQYY